MHAYGARLQSSCPRVVVDCATQGFQRAVNADPYGITRCRTATSRPQSVSNSLAAASIAASAFAALTLPIHLALALARLIFQGSSGLLRILPSVIARLRTVLAASCRACVRLIAHAEPSTIGMPEAISSRRWFPSF
jgi:hypothetical protein